MNHLPVAYVNYKSHKVVFYSGSDKISLRTDGMFPKMFENLKAFKAWYPRKDPEFDRRVTVTYNELKGSV